MRRSFDGKSIAVVGARGGLGSEFCTQLEAAGAHVVRCGRSDADHVLLDIRDTASYVGLDGVPLDGVINATGVVAFGALDATTPEVMDELFITNATGPMWLMWHLAPKLLETKGFFVNISGIVAEKPYGAFAAYGASKAALSSATLAMAESSRRTGVLYVDARPPHTETGLVERGLAGTPPRFPTGKQPADVVARILQAVIDEETQVPSTAF